MNIEMNIDMMDRDDLTYWAEHYLQIAVDDNAEGISGWWNFAALSAALSSLASLKPKTLSRDAYNPGVQS